MSTSSKYITVKAPVAAAAVFMAVLGCPDTLFAQSPSGTTLTLGNAARLATERNASGIAARARAAEADAQAAQRRAQLLPSLSTAIQAGARTLNSASLGIEFPGSTLDPDGSRLGPVHNVDARARLSQSVFDASTLLQWKASGAAAAGEHFAAEATAEMAARRGATAYINVLRARALINARIADSALAAELLAIANQEVETGVGIALDVTRAEAQLAEARAKLILTRSEEERTMLLLRRELGLPAASGLSLIDSLGLSESDEPGPSDDEVVRQAFARRGELRAAAARQAAATLAANAARAERLPTVSLFADAGTNGRNADRLLGTYAYGIEVKMPVFDGFRLESHAAEERARVREAEANVQDTRLAIETEVRSARLDMVAQREAVAAARVRLRLAEQEVAQARERFRAGVSNDADVIAASIALNGARNLVIDALTGFHNARVAYAAARGAITNMQ
jgi:outer membrane protein